MLPFFIIFAITWFLNLFFPWWIGVAPALIIGALMLDRWVHAFLIGFAGVGSAWFVQAFYIHVLNEGILTGRIAEMLQVHTAENVLILTFVIGGLMGAVAATTGYFFKSAFKPDLILGTKHAKHLK